jgi:hypothetical protein
VTEEIHEKCLVRLAGILVGIRIEHLPNVSPVGYRFTHVFGVYVNFSYRGWGQRESNNGRKVEHDVIRGYVANRPGRWR